MPTPLQSEFLRAARARATAAKCRLLERLERLTGCHVHELLRPAIALGYAGVEILHDEFLQDTQTVRDAGARFRQTMSGEFRLLVDAGRVAVLLDLPGGPELPPLRTMRLPAVADVVACPAMPSVVDGLLRLNVGLEDPQDLIADLDQALHAAGL